MPAALRPFHEHQIVLAVHATPGLIVGHRYVVDGYVADFQGDMLGVRTLDGEPLGPFWPWRFAPATPEIEAMLHRPAYFINDVLAYNLDGYW